MTEVKNERFNAAKWLNFLNADQQVWGARLKGTSYSNITYRKQQGAIQNGD